MTEPIRVVLMDDNWLIRKGLRSILESFGDVCVVGDASTVSGAVGLMEKLEWDIVLVDLRLAPEAGKGQDGFDLLQITSQRWPGRPALVITMDQDRESVEQARHDGARGYVLKTATPEMLLRAVRTVANGGAFIDPRLSGHEWPQHGPTGKSGA